MSKGKFEMKTKTVILSLVVLVFAMLLIILPILGFTMFGREKSGVNGDAISSGISNETGVTQGEAAQIFD